MKKFIYLAMILLAAALSACENQSAKSPVIGKQELKLQNDLLTPEVLWSFGRVSDIQLSPDKKEVLYAVKYYDIPQNKGNTDLYTVSPDGKKTLQLTRTPESEFNAIWRPDGKKIGYISTSSGSAQMWEMNPDGSGKKQVSDILDGITGFKYSPDMKKVVFTAEVKLHEKDLDALYKDLPLATGKVINRMMYRHWDEWIETYSHLFLADYDGSKLSNVKDLIPNEPWDVPMKPFWGMEQISWAPDSKSIAYASKKKEGKAYTLSTNSDIYIYDLARNQSVNFTRNMMGYDLRPVYSPDGTRIAWESMPRDGYESDKNRIMVFDFKTNSRTDYTTAFDQDAHNIIWADNSESLYFLANWYGTEEIFRLDMNGQINQLTSGTHDFTDIIPGEDRLITTMQSMSLPTEIFSVPLKGGQEIQVTFTNQEILDQLTMGQVEKRWIETTDGKKMLTWIIYPPHFNPQQKYAALLFCEGGPQSTVSQFWSYRWNFQIMAANNYIVVAPNRRGCPGFGQAWKEEISGDYTGLDMQDYLRAIDVVAKEPFVNKDVLGAVGASYGAYSVYWLAGNHNGRFACFIAHDGMFNLESQYLATDEMWFPNWDLGGPFWNFKNAIAQKSYANSPHRFVQNWKTPILIIHGGQDFRIPSTEGMSAFNAAQLLDVPSQFLYFPDENHWVLKPQNGILWQRTFFAWLDKWLKPPPLVRK